MSFDSPMNADAQKKYANAGADIASKYMTLGNQANPSNFEYYNQQVGNQIASHYENAANLEYKMGGNWKDFNIPKYQFPDPQEAVNSDGIEDAADDAEDNLRS